MSTPVITNSNVVTMIPTVSEDPTSHHLWVLLSSLPDGIVLPEEHGTVFEYHSLDGDIYPVLNHALGYLIEVPRRDTLDILEWIDDEVSDVQGAIDGPNDLFEDVVKPEQVLMVGKFTNVVEGGEEKPGVPLYFLTTKKVCPNGLWLPNGDILPIDVIHQDNYGVVIPVGYVIHLPNPEGRDVDSLISEVFPNLQRTKVFSDDGDTEQVVWLDESMPQNLLEVN